MATTPDPMISHKGYKIQGYDWGTTPELVDITGPIATGYILWRMELIEDLEGEELWETFHDCFDGWEKETWEMADKVLMRKFRVFLRERGVWVRVGRGYPTTKALYNLLQEKEPSQWPEDDLNPQSTILQRSDNTVPKATPGATSMPQAMIQSTLAPECGGGGVWKITDVTRMYTETQKYGGTEDILDSKLPIFFAHCNSVKVPPERYQEAFYIMLKNAALDFYFETIAGRRLTFDEMINKIRQRFETPEARQRHIQAWRSLTLTGTIAKNPEKPLVENFEWMVDRLRNLQRGLNINMRDEITMREQLIASCRGVPACVAALSDPREGLEALISQIRTSIDAWEEGYRPHRQALMVEDHEQNWTNRTYGGRALNRRAQQPFRGKYLGNNSGSAPRQKKCYVCGKSGCWSSRHTPQERETSFANFAGVHELQGANVSRDDFQTFLTQYEGQDDGPEHEVDINVDMANLQIASTEQYFTSLGPVDGFALATTLADQSTRHALTKCDEFLESLATDKQDEIFLENARYSADYFQGIMPDTGAAGVSTGGKPQFDALKKIRPSTTLDTSTAGAHTIRFGVGMAKSLGTTSIRTELGDIIFHILPTNTPFLFCLQDMDSMGVRLDNLHDVLIQGKKRIPVIRKWGHTFLILDKTQTIAHCHLTETELRQVHRRFGHPSVHRLQRVLERAGHGVNHETLQKIAKFCHHCQMNGSKPGRFRFSLKDDYEFNYSIIVDIMYLDGKPVLHVVDDATNFGAARFLANTSSATVWETLRMCWMDTYVGPPDYVVHDAGSNFASKEFKQLAHSLAVAVKEVPVEAHNSVGKVERYHGPLRRAYEILCAELAGEKISKESILQMAQKAVNNTAGPDGIVPTLLVFGTYPRLSELDAPAPSIVKRAAAIKSATKEVREMIAKRKVNEALSERSGPNTATTLNLPLGSQVRVWREGKGWQGPFELLAVTGETCTLNLPSGSTNFRSTVVKPYYTARERDMDEITPNAEGSPEPDYLRPCNPKNARVLRRNPSRDRRLPSRFCDTEIFLSEKEQEDRQLALTLRQTGKIRAPGNPFEASQQQEVDGLLMRHVFELVRHDPEGIHKGVRVFNSRFVNEVKGKSTSQPFEKSRLVVQAYEDEGKAVILTQSPTIQRASQRMILALAPSLLLRSNDFSLLLRDVTQAYTQSATMLNRMILARLPKEMQYDHNRDTIMLVRKPLYGIPEAGTHWWATYNRHHLEKLGMIASTYDPCLLVTTTNKDCKAAESNAAVAIVGMQTDDTLILANKAFAQKEEVELKAAKFPAKPRGQLSLTSEVIFNGCIISLTDDGSIYMRQKDQGRKIVFVDKEKSPESYKVQRARGAYIASICQPEASFDFSVAAQAQAPNAEDIKKVNKRLQWQLHNLGRGLRYIPLDLPKAKLFIFVDGSFANNQDLSSQIGYEILVANETSQNDETFTIRGNLIHWSSVKAKRVTRSVLASEIYAMVSGVDMGISVATTLDLVMKELGLSGLATVVCTDSFSLYECLVKLGTTKEKRLMIDIMALRQSYERCELAEIRWINGADNPADAMTKAVPNKALTKLVERNELTIRMEGWVNRNNDHVHEC